ncbi:MAG: CDP-diacylglycerol--glycerol-3-phosphate 3-phosphatidyltransferase [Actinobacteria bacterium]|nr:CDP-diacylglycerol--glycerol-3-phosphate 3-phosphatidyltransferase [Actinomycetota bacterium]
MPDHAGDPVTYSRFWTGPNMLTVLRLLLVPVFAVLLLADGGVSTRVWAAIVFLVAAGTDVVDGEWARRSGRVTTFGKVADPIADKALTGVALVLLSYLGELPWWVTLVILIREFGVTALRFWVIRHGVIPASRGGKVKTLAQNFAILLFVLPIDLAWLRIAAMAVAVILTVVTGLDYVVRALRLRSVGRNG